MEWQPIETAPKDGTYVLCTDGKFHYLIKFMPHAELPDDLDRWLAGIGCEEAKPTHWLPLPAPPMTAPGGL